MVYVTMLQLHASADAALKCKTVRHITRGGRALALLAVQSTLN